MMKKKSKEAYENTTVTRNGVKTRETLKEGNPLDPRYKFSPNVVGLSVGVTLNLGDFQSLRVDCWVSQEVHEGEDRQVIVNDLTKELQDNINYVCDKFTEE